MDEEIASGNGAGTTTLQWPDYFVIAATLLISAAIGVYYRFTGGRQRTAEEYFSANRSMKIVPLGMAMTVSLMSAISILGISAEAYIHGAMFVLIQIGGALATPMIMYIYLPVFFELRVVSVYEYLEKRFGVTLRLIASTLNFAFTIFYTGIVLFAPSLALEATTGLSKIWSIVLIGSICTFYSTIGGIKAVLITDVFQSVLMVVTVFCVIGIASDEIEGGLSSVWGLAYESGRLDFSNLDLTERNTWFSCVIGGCFVFLSLFGISQVQVQRQLTAKYDGSHGSDPQLGFHVGYIKLHHIFRPGALRRLQGLRPGDVWQDHELRQDPVVLRGGEDVASARFHGHLHGRRVQCHSEHDIGDIEFTGRGCARGLHKTRIFEARLQLLRGEEQHHCQVTRHVHRYQLRPRGSDSRQAGQLDRDHDRNRGCDRRPPSRHLHARHVLREFERDRCHHRCHRGPGNLILGHSRPETSDPRTSRFRRRLRQLHPADDQRNPRTQYDRYQKSREVRLHAQSHLVFLVPGARIRRNDDRWIYSEPAGEQTLQEFARTRSQHVHAVRRGEDQTSASEPPRYDSQSGVRAGAELEQVRRPTVLFDARTKNQQWMRHDPL